MYNAVFMVLGAGYLLTAAIISDLSLVGCYNKSIMSPEERNKLMLLSAKNNLKKMAFFGLTELQEFSQYIFEETFNLKYVAKSCVLLLSVGGFNECFVRVKLYFMCTVFQDFTDLRYSESRFFCIIAHRMNLSHRGSEFSFLLDLS